MIKGEVGCDLGKGRGLMNLAIEKWRVKMKKLSLKKKGRRVRCGVELSVKEFNQGSGPSGERAGQERKNTIHKKREGEREGEKKEKKGFHPSA